MINNAVTNSRRVLEAATGGVLSKKVLLQILQNSQENTCARASFLIKLPASKRDSGTFEERRFYRTPLVAASGV